MCQIRQADGTSACFSQGTALPYNACSAPADCQAGYDCVGGSCQQYCDTSADCSGTFDVCGEVGYDNAGTFTIIPGFKTCSRTCNPALPQSSSAPYQACGAGLACVPTQDNSSVCTEAGSAGHHGSCPTGVECAAGTICIGTECLKGCNNVGGSCSGGETCYGLVDGSQTAINVAGAQIGVCDI